LGNDLLVIFLLSLSAMFNPSLLAAVTVMLLLPSPKRLMIGYLLGAYTTSITTGLLIVFTLNGSSFVSTSKHTVTPLEDIIIGLLLLGLVFVLQTGRDQPLRERRRAKKEAKLEAKRRAGKPTESLPLRMLGKGNPRVTFVVGAALSFPGVSYLAGLSRIHKLHADTIATVLLVLYFCVFQLLLLELPLLGYLFAPDRTQGAISGFRDWMGRRGRTTAVIGAAVLGVWLAVRGVVTIL
jgi:Sap, sulfolipid-1-addressing protein